MTVLLTNKGKLVVDGINVLLWEVEFDVTDVFVEVLTVATDANVDCVTDDELVVPKVLFIGVDVLLGVEVV